MKGKHVSPLLILDVINGAHKRIQGGQSQQAPKEVTQGILTKEKENTRIKHRIQRTRTIKDNSCQYYRKLMITFTVNDG